MSQDLGIRAGTLTPETQERYLKRHRGLVLEATVK